MRNFQLDFGVFTTFLLKSQSNDRNQMTFNQNVCTGPRKSDLCRDFFLCDYCPNSATTLCRRIWISFFDTEELHAVMLDKVADRGGRAAFQVTPTPEDVDVFPGDRRPPGSSVNSRLKAPAQFGAKKDIHILHCCLVKQDGW